MINRKTHTHCLICYQLLVLLGLLPPFCVASLTTQVESNTIITSQQKKLTLQAQEWGLSDEEYARYQSLITGRRGIQSPGLDPLTTLGVEARNHTERRVLAEKWVQQEFIRIEKELAFQREIDAAWQRLYPDALPIQATQVTAINQQIRRFALFVTMKPSPLCDAQLDKILAQASLVDIYVTDSQNDDQRLREWARQKSIPVTRVQRGEITLNHDNGQSARLELRAIPALLQQTQNGSWQPVHDQGEQHD